MTLVGGEQVLRVYYEHTFDTNTTAKKPQQADLVVPALSLTRHEGNGRNRSDGSSEDQPEPWK
jgi:hypothetical protein